MPPSIEADPGTLLAPLLALRERPDAADALRRHLRERLEGLPVVPYAVAATVDEIAAADGEPAGGARGGSEPASGGGALGAVADVGGVNLAVRRPGRLRALRPLVLLARTDRLDPPSLAGLAAVLAVPRLLADANLDRDVIVVLADDGPAPAAAGGPTGPPPPQRPGARSWFDRQRRHDVHAVVVVERLPPSPWSAPGADLLRVAGVDTDARMAPVLEGAGPAGCHLLLSRHGADGLPFAEHEVAYLRVGAAHDPWEGAAGAAAATAAPAGAALDARGETDLERLATHAARLTATLLVRLDGARLPGPYGGHDSTPLEIAAAEAVLGDRFDAIGGPPRTSADVERLLAAGGI
jgi:hypothetical protein